VLLLAIILVTACGDSAEEEAAEQAAEQAEVASTTADEQPNEEPVPFDSLPMPDFPEPQRGRLVAVGAGSYDLDGAWPAVARMCEDPPMMQVIAQEPGIGALVLLQLPEAGQRLTDYPVSIVEEGAPDPPASQVGVQLFLSGAASAFQAMEGQVSVFEFEERISGRFAVILREIGSGDGQKYAGVFQGISIEQIPEEDCLRVRQSLEPADSSASDSTSQ
jgi:hypothetical protein